MLTVANGLTSVPSPLKSMPSTMAFGCATPPTMFQPCVANRYDPCRVCTLQARPSGADCAVADVPTAIAAAKHTDAQPKAKELIIIFVNFVFIVVISFF